MFITILLINQQLDFYLENMGIVIIKPCLFEVGLLVTLHKFGLQKLI